MKLLLIALLLSFACHSQPVKKTTIDTFFKKRGNNMLLLHKLGENYYAGLHYHWRGLSKPDVAVGDTAVLHKGNGKSFYHPYITIIKRKPND